MSEESEQSFGQKGKLLYDAFWSRNGGEAPEWKDQARSIRLMWMNIARDASSLFVLGATRKGGKNSPVRSFRDQPGLASKAAKASWANRKCWWEDPAVAHTKEAQDARRKTERHRAWRAKRKLTSITSRDTVTE